MTEQFPSDPVPVKVATSDLPKRAASAVIMLAVAGAALWQGGVVLQAFIALVGAACFIEFVLLIVRATSNWAVRFAAILVGATYIGSAGWILANAGRDNVVILLGAVIFVDTFAYFFGRTLGGPKIAPKISPSKTWAGLLGGTIGAALWITITFQLWFAWFCEPLLGLSSDFQSLSDDRCSYSPWAVTGSTALQVLLVGFAIAVVAQMGDFFESWLKRRAGVKDSSKLIPGHGGVFDRVDGLLPVSILFGIGQALA